MIDTDRLEDIQCDLGCVAAAMVAACHDVSGTAPCSRTSRDVSEVFRLRWMMQSKLFSSNGTRG